MAVDRRAVMEKTLEQINKVAAKEGDLVDFYKNLGSKVDVDVIPTGSLAVDSVIGGGFAKGRMVEIVGHASSGKTTLALTAVARLQRDKPDANILYVDAENALDPAYAKALGVNLDEVVLCQPSCGESGYQIIEMFCSSGVADLVVVDSLAFMIPKAIIEADYGDEPRVAEAARLNARALPRIAKLCNQNSTTCIVINQWKKAVRMNPYDVGNMVDGQYYQPGGNSLHFILTQMVEIKRVGQIKRGSDIVSNRLRATVKKNKVGAPYRSAEFVITFGKGLDREEELIGLGLSTGHVKQAGSFYSLPGLTEKRYQGRNSLSEELEKDAALADQLEALIKEAIDGKQNVMMGDESEDDGKEGSEESE